MTTTNVPLPEFTPTGLQVADDQAILDGVLQDFVQAFALGGADLSTELTTPQGYLAQAKTYIISNYYALLLKFIAQVRPKTAEGAFQDALGQIYFLTRQPAAPATVVATVTGTPGATLPAGAQVLSPDSTIWRSDIPATYDSATGLVDVVFTAEVSGAGPFAPINSLTIYRPLPDWLDVRNTDESSPGRDVETRQAFEQRRAASVSIGGEGAASNVRAAVASVLGVTDVYTYNNSSGSPINFGTTSYPIPAHSLAVCVAGGDTTSVARAIHSKLDAGCGLVTSAGLGTLETVTIEDTINYAPPYPAYQIRFIRPKVTNVYFSIQVADDSSLPASYILLVQAKIVEVFLNGLSAADGTINVSRARIGGQIVADTYAAAIQSIAPPITPVQIFVGFTPVPTSGASVVMGLDELPICTQDNIFVTRVSI